MKGALESELKAAVADILGRRVCSVSPVSGGDIHQAFKLELSDGNAVFAKCNRVENYAMLKQELAALQIIAPTAELRVPKALACGIAPAGAYLLLEWLELERSGDQYLLGRQLARLHRHTNNRYGWQADNYIGSTPQVNRWSDSWADFWWQSRLEPQLKMAVASGVLALKPYECDLRTGSYALLEAHRPAPSLLHGDLWGGNKAFCGGEPVIFDPASYYGDRETDVAFTHVFGGFTEEFYAGYQAEWPLTEGHGQRQSLYNLYHLFNHLNLFGTVYLAGCEQYIKKVIHFTR